MKDVVRLGAIAMAALTFALSASNSYGQSSAAESACMAKVNSNYGGKVKNLRVVRSEFSQAGTQVIVVADGERWRCNASNDGKVTDLKFWGEKKAAQHDAANAAESACMVKVNSNYGGKVKNLRVIRSEFSQANSEVIVDADGQRWRCLASNDGKVEELSRQ